MRAVSLFILQKVKNCTTLWLLSRNRAELLNWRGEKGGGGRRRRGQEGDAAAVVFKAESREGRETSSG